MGNTISTIIAPTPTQVDPKDQTEVRKALSDLTQSVNTQFNSIANSSSPIWQPYPAGTYIFPSGNQTVLAGILAFGATVTAPTFGTGSVLKAWWRDNGKTIDIMYNISQTTATGTTAGAGAYLLPLPAGKLFDPAFGLNLLIGVSGWTLGMYYISGGTLYVANGWLYYATTNTFAITLQYADSNGTANVASWGPGAAPPSALSQLSAGGIVCGIPVQ
jgi:hypothetical protein